MAMPQYTALLSEAQLSSIEYDLHYSILPRTDLMVFPPAAGTHYNISQAAVDTISAYFQNNYALDPRNFDITDDGPVRGRLNG